MHKTTTFINTELKLDTNYISFSSGGLAFSKNDKQPSQSLLFQTVMEAMCEICSELTTKAAVIFMVNFQHILHNVLVFPLLLLNK